MGRTCIENGRRSTGKESTRRNPCRKEKPRSTVEKMERRTGLNKPPSYMKGRRREEEGFNVTVICIDKQFTLFVCCFLDLYD